MRRQHDDELLAQQLHGVETITLERAAHESHVEGSRLKTRDGVHGVFAVQDQAQVRQVLRQERPQCGQDAHVGRWKSTDRQLARAPIGSPLREPPRVLHACEDILRLLQKDASCMR